MHLSYKTSTVPGKLRVVHTIIIDGEKLETTKAKEVLVWAKPKLFSKQVWNHLREAVRLGTSLEVAGGGVFGIDDEDNLI